VFIKVLPKEFDVGETYAGSGFGDIVFRTHHQLGRLTQPYFTYKGRKRLATCHLYFFVQGRVAHVHLFGQRYHRKIVIVDMVFYDVNDVSEEVVVHRRMIFILVLLRSLLRGCPRALHYARSLRSHSFDLVARGGWH
jgi:hypothetical protein